MQVETSFYPHVEGEMGIPFERFVERYKEEGKCWGIARSGSGAELEYSVGSGLLSVQDIGYPDRFMSVRVDYNGFAIFSLRTRKSPSDNHADSPEAHPDMFAAKFVAFAIDYFEKNNVRLNACKGIWLRDTMNRQMFDRGMSKHGDPVRAASETWSGKLFISLGFTELAKDDVFFDETRPDESDITTIFRRPNRESD